MGNYKLISLFNFTKAIFGPVLWGHSGPLCHALSLLSTLSWTSMRRRRATVATTGECQCKTGGVRRLAVANGPNIFQMLLVNINTYKCTTLGLLHKLTGVWKCQTKGLIIISQVTTNYALPYSRWVQKQCSNLSSCPSLHLPVRLSARWLHGCLLYTLTLPTILRV